MLIINRPHTDPYFNLAAEEYFLKNFEEDLFMLWRCEPSVIVGKHQNALAEINIRYVREHNIKVVRRISGGGTVYHDPGNINFTFIRKGEPGTLVDFKRYTQPVLDLLNNLGVHAVSGEHNSLFTKEKKFSGNAEHIFKNRVLHHGTLLYSTDLSKLSQAILPASASYTDKSVKSIRSTVTNIAEYLKTPMLVESFTNLMLEHIKSAFPDTKVINLTTESENEIHKLVRSKYLTWEWNYGYSPSYIFHKHTLTSSGNIQIEFHVEKGMITHAKIDADFLSLAEMNALECELTGIPHYPEPLMNLASVERLIEYFHSDFEYEFLHVFF